MCVFCHQFGSWLRHGYCGTTIPHHLSSNTNAVELKFISDASIVSSGFRLRYSIGGLYAGLMLLGYDEGLVTVLEIMIIIIFHCRFVQSFILLGYDEGLRQLLKQ